MIVLVGLLPNPEGRTALRAAVEQAPLRDAELLVVNSGRSGDYIDQQMISGEIDHLERRVSTEGIRHRVLQDSEARKVVDPLVIGMRKRTAVGKLLPGSTAQQLLLEAPCRVLAVKP